MYIYQSHMGGFFTVDSPLSYSECFCEECCDSDNLIGYATTRDEAWDLLKNDTDVNGSGGYDYEYVKNFIEANFEKGD